jgi:hypothetical protein
LYKDNAFYGLFCTFFFIISFIHTFNGLSFDPVYALRIPAERLLKSVCPSVEKRMANSEVLG